MLIGAPEFARRAGISERRVQQLIANGRIKASKISSRWMIEESELYKRRPRVRPMSSRMSRALLGVLAGEEVASGYDPAEVKRIKLKVNLLKESENPGQLLSSWVASRAEVFELAAKDSDVILLHSESLINPSGVSDPENEIADKHFFEGYIKKSDLAILKKKYGLIPSRNPNVILRALPMAIPREIKRGLSLADLADHNESRAELKLIEMLKQI